MQTKANQAGTGILYEKAVMNNQLMSLRQFTLKSRAAIKTRNKINKQNHKQGDLNNRNFIVSHFKI